MNPKTGECTRDAMINIERAIARVPAENRQAYIEASTKAPDVVKSEPPLTCFLRRESFDYDAAARGIVSHWEKRKELFKENFTKPLLRLTGSGALGKETIDTLKSGFLTTLPSNDKGHSVVLLEQEKLAPQAHFDMVEQLRCAFYLFASLLVRNSKGKTAGECELLIRFHLDSMLSPTENHSFVSQVFDLALLAMPLRIMAVHLVFCPSDSCRQAFDSTVIANALKALGDHKRMLTGVHVCRSEEEIAEKLMPHGFVRDGLPPSMGGVWKASSCLALFDEVAPEVTGKKKLSAESAAPDETSFEEAAEALASLASAVLPDKKSRKRKDITEKDTTSKASKKAAKRDPSGDPGRLLNGRKQKCSTLKAKIKSRAASMKPPPTKAQPDRAATKANLRTESSILGAPRAENEFDVAKAALQVEVLKRRLEEAGDLQGRPSEAREFDSSTIKVNATEFKDGVLPPSTLSAPASSHADPLIGKLMAMASASLGNVLPTSSEERRRETLNPIAVANSLLTSDSQQKLTPSQVNDQQLLLRQLLLLHQPEVSGNPPQIAQRPQIGGAHQNAEQQVVALLLLHKLQQENQQVLRPQSPQSNQGYQIDQMLPLLQHLQQLPQQMKLDQLLPLLQRLQDPAQQPQPEQILQLLQNLQQSSQQPKLEQILPLLQQLQSCMHASQAAKQPPSPTSEPSNDPSALLLQKILESRNSPTVSQLLEQERGLQNDQEREQKLLRIVRQTQLLQQAAEAPHASNPSGWSDQHQLLMLIQKQLATQQQGQQQGPLSQSASQMQLLEAFQTIQQQQQQQQQKQQQQQEQQQQQQLQQRHHQQQQLQQHHQQQQLQQQQQQQQTQPAPTIRSLEREQLLSLLQKVQQQRQAHPQAAEAAAVAPSPSPLLQLQAIFQQKNVPDDAKERLFQQLLLHQQQEVQESREPLQAFMSQQQNQTQQQQQQNHQLLQQQNHQLQNQQQQNHQLQNQQQQVLLPALLKLLQRPPASAQLNG